jgi:hypothetical protein
MISWPKSSSENTFAFLGEDGIVFLFGEMETKEVHALGFISGFGGRKIEWFDGFDHVEVSLREADFDSLCPRVAIS